MARSRQKLAQNYFICVTVLVHPDSAQPKTTSGGHMSTTSRTLTAVPSPDRESVTAWMQAGNCRRYETDVFFPSDGAGVDRARAICSRCPIAGRCLDYALDNRIEHGVWGGCSERERRRILRRRTQLAPAV